MEDDDDGADGDPEEGRQPAEVASVLVQEYHMMLVSWRFHDLLDVNGVSEVFHVLLVGRDVENRRQRLGELDWEDSALLTELNRRVQAAAVARIVVTIGSIECHLDLRLVVLANLNRHIHVRHVAVV